MEGLIVVKSAIFSFLSVRLVSSSIVQKVDGKTCHEKNIFKFVVILVLITW